MCLLRNRTYFNSILRFSNYDKKLSIKIVIVKFAGLYNICREDEDRRTQKRISDTLTQGQWQGPCVLRQCGNIPDTAFRNRGVEQTHKL